MTKNKENLIIREISKIIIYQLERWIFTIVLILIYIFRMIATGGYAFPRSSVSLSILSFLR